MVQVDIGDVRVGEDVVQPIQSGCAGHDIPDSLKASVVYGSQRQDPSRLLFWQPQSLPRLAVLFMDENRATLSVRAVDQPRVVEHQEHDVPDSRVAQAAAARPAGVGVSDLAGRIRRKAQGSGQAGDSHGCHHAVRYSPDAGGFATLIWSGSESETPSPGRYLLPKDVGVPAVLGEFAQHVEVDPAQRKRPATVTADEIVQRQARRRFSRRETGDAVRGLHATTPARPAPMRTPLRTADFP